MVEQLHHHDFTPHIGKLFRFPGSRIAVTLATVDVHEQARVPGIDRTPFTLIFHGPLGDVLPEGFYSAEIEDGSTLAFYIMPIHTVARDRQDYQAVFN